LDFLNWYDWLGPTNPAAAIFFGFIFTIIVSMTVWFESKKIRTAGIAALTGTCVTLVGVFVLNAVGFYG
jgi:predicted small integral membrane protein